MGVCIGIPLRRAARRVLARECTVPAYHHSENDVFPYCQRREDCFHGGEAERQRGANRAVRGWANCIYEKHTLLVHKLKLHVPIVRTVVTSIREKHTG